VIFPKTPPILPKKLPQKSSFRQKWLTFWGYGTSLLYHALLRNATGVASVQAKRAVRRQVVKIESLGTMG